MTATSDPPLNEPREVTIISFLQLGLSPICAGDQFAAGFAAAVAFHFIGLVIGHCVVKGQFLTGGDVSHRNEDDLALQAQIWLAAVVEMHHAALALSLRRRADKG